MHGGCPYKDRFVQKRCDYGTVVLIRTGLYRNKCDYKDSFYKTIKLGNTCGDEKNFFFFITD